MKKVTIMLMSCLISFSVISVNAQTKNLTGTVSFIPDNTLTIDTKEGKIHVLVADENMDAIFLSPNDAMFKEISDSVRNGKTISIRGTNIGSLSKIYPQQFKRLANKYKKRGIMLNGETGVYRISGYKIIIPIGNTVQIVTVPVVPPAPPVVAQAVPVVPPVAPGASVWDGVTPKKPQ